MHKLWRPLLALLAAAAIMTAVGCSNQPVAIVNGSRITKQEFYDRLEQAAGEQVLGDLIARHMLQKTFQDSGLTLTDDEVAAEVKKVRERMPDEAAWQQALKQQGMTEAEFKEVVALQLKLKKLSEKDVKYTDADLKQFFDKYKDRFGRPATVTLSEIVVSDKAKATKIRQQLNDPKASFATLARQDSLSTYTKERGGMRPPEPAEMVQPRELQAAVAKLQVGQISQPINADGQWYIVKVEERQSAEKADYNNPKIKEQAKEAYLAQNSRQPQEIIEEAQGKAKVQILNQRYKEMERIYGTAQQSLPTFGEQRPQGAEPAGQQPAAPAKPALPEGHSKDDGHGH